MDIVHVAGYNPFAAAPSGTAAYVAGLMGKLHENQVKLSLISVDFSSSELDRYGIRLIPIDAKKQTSVSFLTRLLFKAPFLRISRETIIHTHRPDFMFPFVLFNRRNKKVCTLHGPPEVGIKERKHGAVWRLYSLLERMSLKRIDRYIAVNHDAMDYYVKKEPCLDGRISVIPVGIDCDLFRPMDRGAMRGRYGFEEGDRIIIFIGRFSKEKGLDLLLEAFKELKAPTPGARLVLLGSGPGKDGLERTVAKTGIEGVTFMEPLPHDKIPEILNCADVLALCSLYEGMPTVVLEAMACGVPVVATDVGDVGNVVRNGETGYLVKERGPSQISTGLSEVLERGREFYGNRCVEAAKGYSWDNITERILKLYRELTEIENDTR